VVDLKFRATSCGAVAFVGDAEATKRFEEIAKDVSITNIFQVRVNGDAGIGSGRTDFQQAVEDVPEGTKWEGEKHKSTDLAMLCK
jgi:hypothetical protein